jgi:hypothetical protein
MLVQDLEVVFLFSEKLENACGDVLLDAFDDSVLLQHLSGYIELETVRVDDSLGEAEPLWNELLVVVHAENTAGLYFDVVQLLVWLEQVVRRAARHEQADSECDVARDAEVLESEILLPILRDRLVELAVFVLGNLRRLPKLKLPIFAHQLSFLFDARGLPLLVSVLDFTSALRLDLLRLVFVITHLLLLTPLDVQHDQRPVDLGILLDQLLQLLRLTELARVLL